VRLFDRLNAKFLDGGRGNTGHNGSVMEVRDVAPEGIVLRTAAGRDGLVSWESLTDQQIGRTRMAPGDVLTIDAAQGITCSEHINAMPAGSAGVRGFKGYTAESRHKEAAWLITSDGAERREVMARRASGDAGGAAAHAQGPPRNEQRGGPVAARAQGPLASGPCAGQPATAVGLEDPSAWFPEGTPATPQRHDGSGSGQPESRGKPNGHPAASYDAPPGRARAASRCRSVLAPRRARNERVGASGPAAGGAGGHRAGQGPKASPGS
jgi:hypothetical protein